MNVLVLLVSSPLSPVWCDHNGPVHTVSARCNGFKAGHDAAFTCQSTNGERRSADVSCKHSMRREEVKCQERETCDASAFGSNGMIGTIPPTCWSRGAAVVGVCVRLECGLSRRGTLRTTHGTIPGAVARTRVAVGQDVGAHAGCRERTRAARDSWRKRPQAPRDRAERHCTASSNACLARDRWGGETCWMSSGTDPALLW